MPAGQPEELNRLREELASVIAKSKMTAAELAQTQQQLVDARQAATDLDGRLKLSEAAQVELGAALQQALENRIGEIHRDRPAQGDNREHES